MHKKPLYNKILEILLDKKRYKIAFIGDSLTSTEWIHPNWREVFEYVLKFSFDEFSGEDWWIPEWNLCFFNYALDGASTEDFLEQVKLAEEEVNPNLYIIMGTSNDVELGIDKENHINNLKEIFNILSNKDVIYSPNICSKEEEINRMYQEYKQEIFKMNFPKNIYKIDGYEISESYPRENFYTLEDNSVKDLVHPNVLGNIYIAKMFLEGCFGIEVNPEKYLKDIFSGTVKYPKWK
jgi:hypothetical protein